MKLQPNILVRQRNLKPVTTKGKIYYNEGKIGRLLKNIKRYSLEDRILICAAVSPDNSKGVFLDDKGHEYLITSKDLNSDLTYISSKFVKKKDKKFVGARYHSTKYNSVVKNFLKRPDVLKHYQGWNFGDGLAPSIQVNEEIESMYEVGKCYLADDGEWSFKVLSEKDGQYVIKDLSNGKKYKVEASDLELSNADKVEEEDSSGKIETLRNELESKYKDLTAISDKWKKAKDTLYKSMKKDKNSKEYLKAKKEANSLMSEHALATRAFKDLYNQYKKLGGESNRDWYQASTEWDDAD